MTETDYSQAVQDEAFVSDYMYQGRGSRRPWYLLAWMLGVGAALIAFSQWFYLDLAAWEADPNAEERWEDWITVFLYETGGKGLVRAVIGATGAFVIGGGILAYMQARKVVRRGKG